MTSALSGRTVVVTGASRGIGRATAKTLASQGATVLAVARNEALLHDLLRELDGTGHRAIELDVRDEDGWQKLSDSADRIDGLVAAAGIYGPIGRLHTVDLAAFRDAFEVNFFGTILAVRSCLRRMIEHGGSIVLFGGGGSEPLPGYDAYVTSKSALVRLAENLAAELAADGVRVNAIAPGFVATDIHRATLEAGPDRSGADFHARTVKALADGGFPAEEAGELVAFLLSDAGTSVTGKFLSARWDDWRDDAWRSAQLQQRDSLTMRRVDGTMFSAVGDQR